MSEANEDRSAINFALEIGYDDLYRDIHDVAVRRGLTIEQTSRILVSLGEIDLIDGYENYARDYGDA